ncbi:helix-turn-helix domain-containing protein [Caulobacter hibisci]|uniref:Helix-turn-helix transcriptional regulator n=1 Tax=Caulobacter hibisci TaxID=2035993 RepID=A0ABS0T4K3_9CAUL|nr:helix-turn-helix transcriptional regulator [Caulobacter hibisci]MBI1686787.1 helix-turn-helix transcriptional regulator [Caulobacter hibisci]
MASLQQQVGALVRYHRERAGLTQPQLAERIDRQFGAISRIERGESAPTFKTLSAIAAVLGIEVRDLFGSGGYAAGDGRADLLAHMFDQLTSLPHDELPWIAGIIEAAISGKTAK